MNKEKAKTRVDSLLRLAAPASNTTEAERASAALEAAKLIAEYGLTYDDRPADPAYRRPAPRRYDRDEAAPVHNTAWVLNVAPHHTSCSACGLQISARDVVWMRVGEGLTLESRHNAGACKIQ